MVFHTTLSGTPFDVGELSRDNNYTDNVSLAMDTKLPNGTVVFPSLMFSACVIGNVLSLVLMATSPPGKRKTMFYKLMAGLSFTDLIGTCSISPVVISVYATNVKLEKEMPLCHYCSFMLIFSGYATLSLVCAMAIERYICVCHPYIYHCKLPKSYAKYAFISGWLVSILIATLPLIGLGHNTVQYPETWCFFNSTSTAPKDVAFNLIYATIALIAILITLICNVAAIMSLLGRKRSRHSLNASLNTRTRSNQSLTQRYAELQMAVMVVGVTILFIVCYGPLMVFIIICQTTLTKYIDVDQVHLLLLRLATFNPILDPWVYLLARREFRWKIVHAFKFIFGTGIRNYPAFSKPGRELHSPVSCNTIQKPGTEMSCLTFCCQRLCDPPSHKSSLSLTQTSTTLATQTNLSPLCESRLASADSVLNNTPRLCIISQPSLPEELFLQRFSCFEADIVTYGVSDSPYSQSRT